MFLYSILTTVLLSAQTYATLTTENGLMENFVTDIYQDTDGLMYLGTFRGVSRFDGQHVVNIPFRMKVENEINYITAIVAQDREHLLVGNAVGLWQLDKRHLTLTRVFDDDIDCGVTGMRVVAAKGSTPRKVIIETQFGVFALIDDHLQKISNRHCMMPVFGKVPTRGWGRFPIANNQFISPRDGTRWVSYNFFGVDYSYLNRGIFHVFERPGLIDTRQLALRNFLHDGTRLFLGTCKGLFVYDSATRVYRPVASEFLGNSVIAQIMRTDNNYLVATVGQGLFVLNAHSLLPKTVFLPNANVYQLSSNGHGQIWISSSQGVGCYDVASGKLRQYNTHNSQLPSNEVFCIGIESTGTAWISTAGGLCQYRPDIDAIAATGLPARLRRVGLLRSIEPLPKGRLMLIPQHGTARIYDVAANSLRTVAL